MWITRVDHVSFRPLESSAGSPGGSGLIPKRRVGGDAGRLNAVDQVLQRLRSPDTHQPSRHTGHLLGQLKWLISKIEYVIRSSVKSWLEPEPERDSQADSDTPASPVNRDITSDIANRDITRDIANRDITGLCERFRVENEALIGSFARLFVRAYAYVTASIDLYKQEFDIAPVLRPTPENLNKLE